MDEEQQLGSPLSGSIRGIRRSVSSGIFTGRSVLPSQPDPQTTQLLTQNSLTLTTVSTQLSNISGQVQSLTTSLSIIRDNLAVNDNLERQREAAKQKREAILAEQALREGKESQLEKRVQNALVFPVQRVAQKAQGILGRVAKFLLILVGGWLTERTFKFLNLTAEGNKEGLTQFKKDFLSGLLILAAIFVSFKFALAGIGAALTALSAKFLVIAGGALLTIAFVALTDFIRANVNNFRELAIQSLKDIRDYIKRIFGKGNDEGDGMFMGGLVKGPEGIDKVPARLTAGEFVIRKNAVDLLGEGFLQSLNSLQKTIPSDIKPENIKPEKPNLQEGIKGNFEEIFNAMKSQLSSNLSGLDQLSEVSSLRQQTSELDETENDIDFEPIISGVTDAFSNLIQGVNMQRGEIAQNLNLEGSPAIVDLTGGSSSGNQQGAPTTSSKKGGVELPVIDSTDIVNDFVELTKSYFNIGAD